MPSHPDVPGTFALLTRVRAVRRAHRDLVHELADYATPAERDGLEALIEEQGAADDEVARILLAQAQAQLFRAR